MCSRGSRTAPSATSIAEVIAALRLGAYQLLYMDGVADHAAVTESVDLAKTAGSRGHGLVNAVLRRTAREGRAALARLGDATPAAAGLLHSHPDWVARDVVGAARGPTRRAP